MNEVDFIIASMAAGAILMPALILFGLLAESTFATLAFFVLSPFWVWVVRRPDKWKRDAEIRAGLPEGFYG